LVAGLVAAPNVQAQASLCELFSADFPPSLESGEVRVRGELLVGEEHLALVETFCDLAISIDSRSYPVDVGRPVAVSLRPGSGLSPGDARRLAEAVEEFRRIRSDGHSPRGLITLSGRIEVRRGFRLDDVQDDAGEYTGGRDGNGFGPNGVFRAEIEIESIDSLIVMTEPGVDELPAVPICDLVSNLSAWHGRRVAVRAMTFNTSEVASIVGDCERGFVTEGLDWGTQLSLSVPAWYVDTRTEAVFGVDIEATVAAWREGAEARRGRDAVRRTATFVGTIQMHPSPSATCGESGAVDTWGFDHLGYAPARFLLEAVRDVTITEEDSRGESESQRERCELPDQEEICLRIRLQAKGIVEAARYGCLDQVRQLLSGGSSAREDVFDALVRAASNAREEIAFRLLDAVGDVTTVPGITPEGLEELFRNAVFAGVLVTGRFDLVRAVLEAGIDPNLRAYRSSLLGSEGLFHPPVAEILLEAGADPNSRTYEDTTVLMDASAYGYADVVRVLLAYGADVDLRDDEGRTALMHTVIGDTFIAGRPYTDAIPILLQNRSDPNVTDNNGKTALDYARELDLPWAIELLEPVTASTP
jgi:hypothetical protein